MPFIFEFVCLSFCTRSFLFLSSSCSFFMLKILCKLCFVIVIFGAFHISQNLIAVKPNPIGVHDEMIIHTMFIRDWLFKNPEVIRWLLIASSLWIDIVFIYLVKKGIVGSTMRPIFGLCFIFTLRQLMMALVSLPIIESNLWRDPQFPSLCVTYGTTNDFFFSGHTSLAVYGAIELCRVDNGKYPKHRFFGWILAVFEIAFVSILHAHYTMDIFTGIFVAVSAANFACWLEKKVTIGFVQRVKADETKL